MVVDDDVLEKEDMYILDRMKEFISTEEVSSFAAAKQLMILIERLVSLLDALVEFNISLCHHSNVVVVPSPRPWPP